MALPGGQKSLVCIKKSTDHHLRLQYGGTTAMHMPSIQSWKNTKHLATILTLQTAAKSAL